MEMNFQQHLDSHTFDPFLRAIFNTYRGALEYPASREARATKIAHDTVFFINDSDPDVEAGGAFNSIWWVLMHMVSHIPAGHDWQQTLVLAFKYVRQQEPAESGKIPVCSKPLGVYIPYVFDGRTFCLTSPRCLVS